MGIVNARNLKKAKQLLEKNRHKVGDAVGKATTKLDKVSGGKTANLSAKAEEAARKYSAGGATHHGVHPDAVSDGQMQQSPPNAADVQARQGEANVTAANAMKSAADAATKLFNKAAAAGGATGSDGLPPPPAAETATDAPPPLLNGPPPLPEPDA